MDAASFPPAEAALIQASLLAWFAAHARALPWRGDALPGDASPPLPRTPYGVWVSEVMLQQTRVAAVVVHWRRWMARFPTIAALAAAPLDEVNAAWAGLGFYRRAANLHRGAQHVTARCGGQLPAGALALQAIPGIGPYTAGAIASIAQGAPEAVVDGNVVRVLARLRALAAGAKAPALHKAAWRLARALVPQQRAGDFNEALMELGATVCVPKGAPACGACPVRRACLGFAAGLAATASSGGSSSSGGGGGGAAGDIEDVGAARAEAAAKWLAERFPSKPEPKSATPRQAVTAVVIEHCSSGGESRYLLVRSSGALGSGSGGGGALLQNQWGPVSVAMGAAVAAAAEEEEEEEEGEGAEEEEEVVVLQEGGGGKGKRKPAAKGGKRGAPRAAAPLAAAAAAAAAAAPKRAKRSAAAAPLAAAEGLGTAELLAKVEEVLGLTGSALDGVSASTSTSASASASASSSRADAASCALSFATQGAPGTTTHIFSHVVHDLTVHHWRLVGGRGSGGGGGGGVACSSGGGAAAAEPRGQLLAAITRPGLQAQWCDLPGLASGVGLTSWAARVLFVALRGQARAFFSAEAGGSGGGAGGGSGGGGELAAAWRTLRERWSKCGCKL